MIKHFDVWPITVDKNDLFEEQKHFLIYLMGVIPDMKGWKTQVDYQTEKQEIDDLKKVELSPADIDVANIQGKSISELKKERLKHEKRRLKHELNKKYGIEDKENIPERPEGIPEKGDKKEDKQQQLWDLLQGKGLIKAK